VHDTDLHWPGRGRGCVRVCVCARALVLQRFLDLTSEVVLFKKKLRNKATNYLSCVTLAATSVSLRRRLWAYLN